LHAIEDHMIYRVETRRGQGHQRLDRRLAAEGMDGGCHAVFLNASNGSCKRGLAPRAAVPQKDNVAITGQMGDTA
jgi:hypothetical protein